MPRHSYLSIMLMSFSSSSSSSSVCALNSRLIKTLNHIRSLVRSLLTDWRRVSAPQGEWNMTSSERVYSIHSSLMTQSQMMNKYWTEVKPSGFEWPILIRSFRWLSAKKSHRHHQHERNIIKQLFTTTLQRTNERTNERANERKKIKLTLTVRWTRQLIAQTTTTSSFPLQKTFIPRSKKQQKKTKQNKNKTNYIHAWIRFFSFYLRNRAKKKGSFNRYRYISSLHTRRKIIIIIIIMIITTNRNVGPIRRNKTKENNRYFILITQRCRAKEYDAYLRA